MLRAVAPTTTNSVSPIACRVTRGGTAQSGVASGATTKVIFTSADFNEGGGFDLTTSRFQPGVAGYYRFTASLASPLQNGNVVSILVYKNGTLITLSNAAANANASFVVSVNDVVQMNGTTDYLEVYGQSQSTANPTSFSGVSALTYFAANGFVL